MLRLAVGAGGDLLGEALLELLEERAPADMQLILLEGEDDEGTTRLFRGKRPPRAPLSDFDFRDADIALFPGGAGAAAEAALAGGCHVIDTPGGAGGGSLAVAEVNAGGFVDIDRPLWLTSPAPVAVMLSTVLHVLQPVSVPVRLDAFVCRAVSHRGSAGIESLAGESARLLNGQSVKRGAFGQQSAFNVLPEGEDTGTLADEVRTVLGDWALTLNLSMATVPVFYGDSISVRLECAEPLDIEAVRRALAAAAGTHLLADEAGFSPVSLAGDDRIHVGNLQWEAQDPRALHLWIIADNVRKGAALNIIQLMEILIKMSH